VERQAFVQGAYLVDDGGARVRVGPEGVLVGRGVDSDLILASPEASRRHAWVRRVAGGVEVIPMGQLPVERNGRALRGPSLLDDGDTLSMPGGEFRIELGETGGGSILTTGPQWALQSASGALLGVGERPVRVGGGAHDHFGWEGLPSRALVFTRAQGALYLEARVPADCDSAPLEVGSVQRLRAGAVVTVGQRRLVVVSDLPDPASTLTGPERGPAGATLKMLPIGGELHLEFPQGQTLCLRLSELRTRLMAVLARPPEGYVQGEALPDELVIPAVWPRAPNKSRLDLNTLVYRIRRSLLGAGVDPLNLLSREPLGGATRLALPEGVELRLL